MHNLDELCVGLDIDGFDWDTAGQSSRLARLLEPVKAVTVRGHFELVISCPSAPDLNVWDALPCTIRRVNNLNEI
jgi:hypothetical protein